MPHAAPHPTRSVAVLAVAAALCACLAASAGAAATDATRARLLVEFRADAPRQQIAQEMQRAHVVDHSELARLNVHVVTTSGGPADAALNALRRSPSVLYAESDEIRQPETTTPNDPLFPIGATYGGEWGSFLTDAPEAWDLTRGSAGVVIADVDSGLAAAHPDLSTKLVPGHNVLDGSSDTSDTYGHGTWVAGVMAGASNNGTGIASYCWDCSLMPVKVYSSSSGAFDSDIAAGITWAVDHGARVVNISLAGPGTSTTLGNAVAYARQHGAVVVAAAGNSSCNCPQYPAAYPGVISVAASTQSDTLYSYSNYGSWVDLAAPGQNVTTMLADPITHAPYGYGPVGGTSMAAPVISGIAGLLFSTNSTLTGDSVEKALLAGVDAIAGNPVAAGRINAYKALLALGQSGAPPTLSPPSNTTAPSISGLAQAAQTLTAFAGGWSDSPTGYAYQWLVCDGAGGSCTAVGGATASTYAVQTTDVGSTLRVAVTATNSAGAATAVSAQSAVIASPPAPPPPSSQTVVFSGSLNTKNPSRSFSLNTGAGVADARLKFSKCKSLSLSLSGGPSTTGPSVVVLDTSVPGGAHTYLVSGGRCSFTLTVTSPVP